MLIPKMFEAPEILEWVLSAIVRAIVFLQPAALAHKKSKYYLYKAIGPCEFSLKLQ